MLDVFCLLLLHYIRNKRSAYQIIRRRAQSIHKSSFSKKKKKKRNPLISHRNNNITPTKPHKSQILPLTSLIHDHSLQQTTLKQLNLPSTNHSLTSSQLSLLTSTSEPPHRTLRPKTVHLDLPVATMPTLHVEASFSDALPLTPNFCNRSRSSSMNSSYVVSEPSAMWSWRQ